MKWKFICGFLVLFASHLLLATDALYQNNSVLQYTVPGNPPPTIDATVFDNENVFSISQFNYSPQAYYFEPWNTLYYTNNGTMILNSPNTTDGTIFFTFGTGAYAIGFNFDTQTANVNPHSMAGGFYNNGTIRCASTLDGNNLFNVINVFGTQLYSLSSYGNCLVSATNIVSPGTIDVSVGGLIQLNGQNVDLSFGVLTNEALLDYTGLFNSINLNSTGAVGVDTNFDWNPGIDLGPGEAFSSFVSIPPYFLNLTNSTAYFDARSNGTNGNIIRAVFVENDTPDMPYRVFIDPPDVVSPLAFEPGAAHVEWDGHYIDPATGNGITNYLYLTDNYAFGASTNVLVINGVPDNFSFVNSTFPLLANPVSSGFLDVFTDAYITNSYAFFNAQLLASSVSTNVTPFNPHGSITNLPGRVEITADKELNMANTIIAGQSYLSLAAPHQFDGNTGANIISPFSDINLGVTNGSMTISNLLVANIPTPSGIIQAWSTRWIEVDAAGVTNDYRVLLVKSQLQATTIPWIKDLKLHSTNLVISDALNVYNSANIDARSLTVTTNGIANGATSIEGDINWTPAAIFGNSQMPNLLWLTNNGAIHASTLGEFMSNSNIVTVVPSVSAAPASGTLSELNPNLNVVQNSTVSIGTYTYTFVNKLANASPNQVKIASQLDGTLNNLIAAINAVSGAGTSYSTNTLANSLVMAGSLTNHSFVITARIIGSAWNAVETTTTSANLTWNGYPTLSGGVDYAAAITNVSSVYIPYQNFVNNGLLADQGSTIWANHFENSGTISNGVGSFQLTTLATVLTNGSIIAGSDISISADSLVASNVFFQAGRSVTLNITNQLTDSGITNGSIWVVQTTNGTGGNAMIMRTKPAVGDLLGTTITNNAPSSNRQSVNVWAGEDRGVSANGFTNNAAVGQMLLDAHGLVSQFKFSGAGVSNAIYVDRLVFLDYMTNGINNSFDFGVNLSISPNMMVYFAQATTADGTSIAAKIDEASKAGRNGGRLRWVPSYAGHFSSVNLVYPDGTTNTVNAALASSSTADSNGNGIPNGSDPAPFFVSSQMDLNIATTNTPAPAAVIQWSSIPGSTNYVYYKTNLASSAWLTLTNFVSPTIVPPAGGWPIINTVFDSMNSSQPRFYNVTVIPNSASLNGQ